MGEALKVQAIVLRYVDYKEADRMLTLFSLQKGKISVCARGVKRVNAKLRAACEPLTYGNYVLAESGGRYTLTQFDAIDSFFELRGDFAKLSMASFMLKLCEQSTAAEEKPDLFALLLRGLDALRTSCDPTLVLCAFLIRFYGEEGYLPVLDCCAECGGQTEKMLFDAASGGMVCLDCAKPGARNITAGCVYFLKKLTETEFDGLSRLRPSKLQMSEMLAVLTEYGEFCLEGRLKAAEYLKKYGLI